MKMKTSVTLSLLSMPWLVFCDTSELTISMLPKAQVGNRHLRLSSPDTAYLDGTSNDGDDNDRDPTPLFQERVLRKLQFATDACNSSNTELWEDQALNDAYTAYSTNYDEAITSLANCVDASSTNIQCSVDGPIDGEAEYQSACTNAGGEIIPFEFDLSCDGTFQGKATRVRVDLPPISNCVPASSDFDGCADALREVFQNVTDMMAVFYEYGLTSGGYAQVRCDAGDMEGGAGGSSDATTRGMQTFFPVTLFSLIMMFVY